MDDKGGRSLVSAEENMALVLRIFDLFSGEHPEATGGG
jgi:hypothetical protein